MNTVTKSLILTLVSLRIIVAAPEIIGGKTVEDPDSYNFVANIFKNGRQFCTGTRISENFIITAGHCMLPDQSNGEIVFANSGTKDTSILPQNNDEVVYAITNQVAYPGFNVQKPDKDDILLMEIEPKDPSKTVTFKSSAVSLDDGTYSKEGQNALAMGYGITSVDSDKATQLQQTNLIIASFKACQKAWLGSSEVFDSQICAGTRTKNPCIGDSGGPLFLQDTPGHVYLLGTVSFGTDCGVLDLPSVYTRIEPYRDWINNVLKQFPPVTATTTSSTTTTKTTTTTSTTTNLSTSITTTTNTAVPLSTSTTTTTSSSAHYGPSSTSTTTTKSTSVITSNPITSSPTGYAGSSSTSPATTLNVHPKSSTSTFSNVYSQSQTITSSSGYAKPSSSISTILTSGEAYTVSITSKPIPTITTTASFGPYIIAITSATSTVKPSGGEYTAIPTPTTTTTSGGEGYIVPISPLANPGPTTIPPGPLPQKCRVVTIIG